MRRNFQKDFFEDCFGLGSLCAALWNNVPRLMANPLGLPLGLQLYSVRDLLPKDYEGTLQQLARSVIAKWRLRAFSATLPAK